MQKKFNMNWLMAVILFLGSLQILTAQTTTIWVTSSNDAVSSVPGELRYAITQANLNAGTTIIKFNIPGTGLIPINLVATLPVISKTVWIDATTQAGYSFGSPTIAIDGSNSGSQLAIGINITSAPGCKLLGLYIRNFDDGVNINFSDNCEVRNCVINRNPARTLVLKSSSYCTIKGNYINTDKDGTKFILSPVITHEGIFLVNNSSTGCTNNIIGGTACEEGNTIAHTGSEGIDNEPSPASNPALNKYNTFSGNIIYGNAFDAIELRSLANDNLTPPTISVTGCTTSGTTVKDGIVELFGSDQANKKNAKVYIKSVTANASGVWSTTLNSIQYPYITATYTATNNNTSGLTTAVPITQNTLSFTAPSGTLCFGGEVTFTNTSSSCPGTTYEWDFGDGSPISSSPVHTFLNTGTFTIKMYALNSPLCPKRYASQTVTISPCTNCENCIGSFSPDDNTDYIISAWVKKENHVPTDLTYTQPQIYIDFPGSSVGPFTAKGQIIDGWQRIEEKFTVPSLAANITIRLACTSANCLFDDIRVFPVDGSMKSYVYDPINLRLVAELDERNYATFYDYDEEGKLVRVKKETEKGIMTIKENKNNTTKK